MLFEELVQMKQPQIYFWSKTSNIQRHGDDLTSADINMIFYVPMLVEGRKEQHMTHFPQMNMSYSCSYSLLIKMTISKL